MILQAELVLQDSPCLGGDKITFHQNIFNLCASIQMIAYNDKEA